jgi:hypothetical protein
LWGTKSGAMNSSRHFNFCSEGASEISQLRSGWLDQQIVFVPEGTAEMAGYFSIVPFGTNFIRRIFQPLRSWLISFVALRLEFNFPPH